MWATECGPTSRRIFRRLAEHPEVERPGLELAQALVPGDRDLVGPPESPGCQVLLEAFVDRGEQEIMADADLDSGWTGHGR